MHATKIGRGADRNGGQTFLTSSRSDTNDLAKCHKEYYKTILILKLRVLFSLFISALNEMTCTASFRSHTVLLLSIPEGTCVGLMIFSISTCRLGKGQGSYDALTRILPFVEKDAVDAEAHPIYTQPTNIPGP
jgi:hypothetical protein